MINYWDWLFFLLPALLVCSIKPQAPTLLRTGRLIIAVGMAYALINLSFYRYYEHGWEAFKTCQSQFQDGSINQHEECGTPPRGGIPHMFYLFLGWIPAAAYVGLWELCWRRRYHKTIQDMGKTFRGKWVSNSIIGVFLFCVAYPFIMTIFYIIRYWERLF